MKTVGRTPGVAKVSCTSCTKDFGVQDLGFRVQDFGGLEPSPGGSVAHD